MAKEPRRIGFYLPLSCEKHGNCTFVQEPDHFKDLDAGCGLPCKAKLSCGHACTLKCHPFPHNGMDCLEPCSRVLVCGHACTQLCHAVCKSDCQCIVPKFEQETWPINYAQTLAGSQVRGKHSRGSTSSTAPARQPSTPGAPLSNSRAASKQSYRDYASGGHAQFDKDLANVAARHAVEARLKLLDDKNAAALFGDSEDALLVDKAQEMKLVRTKPDGKGGMRGRWTGTYEPARRENAMSGKQEKASLMDL